MVRPKRLSRKLTILLPAQLKRDLDKLVVDDGRSMAEVCRSLFSQALREKRLPRTTA